MCTRLTCGSLRACLPQGDALCEVTFDSSLLGPGAPLPAASEEDAAGGWRARCHVAIAPRAELPLLLMLLSIYR